MTSEGFVSHDKRDPEKNKLQPLLTSNVLFHLGLRKSGTTWLQKHLFGRDDTGFWSPSAPPDLRARHWKVDSLSAIQKAYTRLLYQDNRGRILPDEDFDLEEIREQFQRLAVPAQRCAVFSDERLSGYPLSNEIDRAQICSRIEQVCPNARILIVIREQRSMILSNYMQCLKHGGGYSIDQYINGRMDPSTPALTFHYFKYDRLIRLYQSVFGPDRILVIPFELMRESPHDYVNRICQFGGVEMPENLPFRVKVNDMPQYLPFVALRRIVPFMRSSRGNAYSPSILGRSRGRAAHRWMVRALGMAVPPQLDKRAKERLQRRVEEIVQDSFAVSNRETEELIGMDLGGLGYCV